LNKTRVSLVQTVAKETGFTQHEVKIILDSLLNTISNNLKDGNNIELRGFGRFKVKTIKPRTVRNPMTGEILQLGEQVKPIWEASDKLKSEMNEK
jgi:nucleoid DNA-binding protein